MILNLLLEFPLWLIERLPVTLIEIQYDNFQGLQVLFANLGYIFPMEQLFTILVVSIGLKSLQIVWAVILRLKSFIPTMGA